MDGTGLRNATLEENLANNTSDSSTRNAPTALERLLNTPTTVEQLQGKAITSEQLANDPSVIAEEIANQNDPAMPSDPTIPTEPQSIGIIDNLSKGAGMGLAKTKTSTWHFRPSPVNDGMGPSTPLETELKKNGIIIDNKNTAPLHGGIGKAEQQTLKISTLEVNGKNGRVAEGELTRKLRQNTILGVREQVVHNKHGIETGNGKRIKGSRVSDAVQKNLAGDIHEVKVGRVNLNQGVRKQLAGDIRILEKANGIPSAWSKTAKLTGKVLRPIGLLTDGTRLVTTYNANEKFGGRHFQKTASEIAGGWTGALSGMALGATAGAGFFGIGAVPGAIIGGIIGAFGGEWAGGQAYDVIAGQ
jgi:hypothetical protein